MLLIATALIAPLSTIFILMVCRREHDMIADISPEFMIGLVVLIVGNDLGCIPPTERLPDPADQPGDPGMGAPARHAVTITKRSPSSPSLRSRCSRPTSSCGSCRRRRAAMIIRKISHFLCNYENIMPLFAGACALSSFSSGSSCCPFTYDEEPALSEDHRPEQFARPVRSRADRPLPRSRSMPSTRRIPRLPGS